MTWLMSNSIRGLMFVRNTCTIRLFFEISRYTSSFDVYVQYIPPNRHNIIMTTNCLKSLFTSSKIMV